MKRTAITALACAAMAAATTLANAQTLSVSVVTSAARNPIYVTAPPGDDRLFVVEQGGTIRIFEDGAFLPEPFLDISGEISSGGERGLLGLAFHPDYRNTGRFFVNYTDRAGNTQIAGYRVSDDPDRADPGSATPILSFDQPASNHNGGWIGFGPDSYLYIATGDGGAANDRFGNGQDPDSLLAKILRIDVDRGDPYAIPPANAFPAGGGAPEVFVWGLRNPWRASFDEHDLFIADVGQRDWEEVSVVSIADAGANLGWSIMEGTHCFQASSCDTDGLVLPVYEYSHEEGCSITGGYVYRGDAMPALRGHYFFADYCSGFVRSFRYEDGAVADLTDWAIEGDVGSAGQVTSFGEDADGALYITNTRGEVLRIEGAEGF